MKHSQTIGFIAVVLAILVCFMPWVFIESKNLTITGFKAEGTRFGRPGMFIVYMGSIAAFLFLIPKAPPCTGVHKRVRPYTDFWDRIKTYQLLLMTNRLQTLLEETFP